MFDEGGPTFGELLKQALSSTREGYDALAAKFDKTPFRTPKDVVETALSVLEDSPIESALDLCCGTGAGLEQLATRVTKRLVGVDFSRAMLAEAKKPLGIAEDANSVIREGCSIELLDADIFSTKFDAEFDLVTCFGAFGHILPESEARFVDLVRAALKPGGRFVFVTTERPPFYEPRALLARTFNAAMVVRNALISPPFIMYYLTFLLPEIERLLRFKRFEVTRYSGRFVKPYETLEVVVATRPMR